jgi:hypothetical protein
LSTFMKCTMLMAIRPSDTVQKKISRYEFILLIIYIILIK